MLEFNTFSFSLLTFFSLTQALWLIFFIAVIFFTVTAFVFLYHWVSYGDNVHLTTITMTFYIGGGIFFLAIIYALIIAF